MIAPKVTSYVTPTRREAPPTTTRIITRVPTADEAREILRGEHCGCDDVPPAPLDRSKVKAGDTVTLEMEGGRKVTAPVSERTVPGKTKGTWFLDVYSDGSPVSFSAVHWTLTAHQTAPEPEPEWTSEERHDG